MKLYENFNRPDCHHEGNYSRRTGPMFVNGAGLWRDYIATIRTGTRSIGSYPICNGSARRVTDLPIPKLASENSSSYSGVPGTQPKAVRNFSLFCAAPREILARSPAEAFLSVPEP